ncbi:DUF2214 family protein [Pseudomonas mediterranea]|jgi:uncharacterized membrane protein|uniref:Predicted membrane protein n=1 Tax=Pseudomonas mediterranea TaxID=183795 RepID=A0AAX2DDI8_9PSED|nr:DUF6644 family protein [Pseudomonas mediterranea]KGU83218.1 membrane protein [Pseudomonas mediterranea CFBP 5447]MBL0841633.1 DUF2214 family protein [Pseudomonas mediterranea]MDU9030188.1 DUF6644 family protein [Pseudomonas mediterranea]QHA82823.1 DUF2214 family protein [Pseudomonas mediterranea]UZD98641.1 DUF2214 family protein [Pseudomonas mediterranea]
MDIQSNLQALEATSVASLIRESGFAFPTLESVHVIGIALVFGTIAVVDLRLLGIASHRRSALRLIQELLPYTWVAFAACVITGLLMFVSNASTYAQNPVFWAKMGLLLLAGLNMGIFHLGVFRRIGEWDTTLPPPGRARVAGFGSMVLWAGVICLGRWIAFF